MVVDITHLGQYKGCSIKTDSGYSLVTDTFTKQERCVELHFSDWTILKVAHNHLFELEDGSWKKADELVETDLVFKDGGVSNVINKIPMGVETVYDLTVDTDKHQYYLDGLSSHNSGKNVIATSAACALRDVKNSKYEKIVYIRKTITSVDHKNEELGFLPGSIEDKMSAYLKPLYNTVETLIKRKYKSFKAKTKEETEEKVKEFITDYNIQYEYEGFLRGSTISNAVVILDEFANDSMESLRLVLTRIGENCKVYILGDINQIDNPYTNKWNNALSFMLNQATKSNDEGVEVVAMNLTETVRSKIAKFADGF